MILKMAPEIRGAKIRLSWVSRATNGPLVFPLHPLLLQFPTTSQYIVKVILGGYRDFSDTRLVVYRLGHSNLN